MMTQLDATEVPYPLIGPDDPPPVSVLRPRGTARVVLTGDHVSRAFPRAMHALGLPEEVLRRHVAYDIGTHRLITKLSEHLDAPAVLAGYSRLLIDPNRSLEDPELIPPVSDGIVIPGNRDLDEAQRRLRIRSFWTPYRVAIDRVIGDLRARGVVPALISLHSFTPELAGQRRPWHVGVLWDKDPRIPLPLMKHLHAHWDLNVGDNQPYSGKHPADFTVDHHAEAAGLPHASVEVRQDLIDSDDEAERWAGILADALEDILADEDLYRVRED